MKYYRKVIHIAAEDSPNVKLGLREQAAGEQPTNRIVIEGVLPWDEYEKRRLTWDPVRQCIGLDGRFWEGADILLFPPHWLNRAEDIARQVQAAGRTRVAKGVGVDTGEGVSDTVWTAVDQWGIIDQVAKKTPNTALIRGETIAFLNKWGCLPDRCCFDRGGGGTQVAHELREMGYQVRTVAFGETLTPDLQRHQRQFRQKVVEAEAKYVYKNRRAQMYHAARLLIEPTPEEVDPTYNANDYPHYDQDQGNGQPRRRRQTPNGQNDQGSGNESGSPSFFQRGRMVTGFGIPSRFVELRRQLAPMPLLYDNEGRIWMLPKQRKEGDSKDKKTLFDLLGCSPDEADSFVLAVYAMQHKGVRATAGTV